MVKRRMSKDGKTLIVEIPIELKRKYDPHDTIAPTPFPVYDSNGVDVNPFSRNNIPPGIKVKVKYV